ncbi:putative reverse transcriptase domain-containing protein [Tanacetum coccineum]
MESVFNISGCAIENQVKFATCTLLGAALTWGMGEIKKLEIELWNLKVKGNDVPTYNEHFQELTLICTKFIANETDKVDKYISGLPDNIFGNVKSARPKTLDETIELANDLMDQKLCTYAERQTDNKRKADDSSRNNHGYQQQPFKRQNVAKVYNMGSGEKKSYGGSLPKRSGNTNVANTQKGNGANSKGNGYFECRALGHFKRDCPKLKNKDGEMGMHKAGYTQLEMQRRMGMHLGTQTQMSSRVSRVLGKGCQIFLAQISDKKEEDKSQGKQLKDVPIVRDFPKVFPEDLPDLRSGLIHHLENECKIFQRRQFRTSVNGHYYEFQVMPFGLTNAPATRESTNEHHKEFWELLQKENLYAKFSNVKFRIPKVQLRVRAEDIDAGSVLWRGGKWYAPSLKGVGTSTYSTSSSCSFLSDSIVAHHYPSLCVGVTHSIERYESERDGQAKLLYRAATHLYTRNYKSYNVAVGTDDEDFVTGEAVADLEIQLRQKFQRIGRSVEVDGRSTEQVCGKRLNTLSLESKYNNDSDIEELELTGTMVGAISMRVGGGRSRCLDDLGSDGDGRRGSGLSHFLATTRGVFVTGEVSCGTSGASYVILGGMVMTQRGPEGGVAGVLYKVLRYHKCGRPG